MNLRERNQNCMIKIFPTGSGKNDEFKMLFSGFCHDMICIYFLFKIKIICDLISFFVRPQFAPAKNI